MPPRVARFACALDQEAELASLGLLHDLRNPLSAAASAFHVLEAVLGQGDEETRFSRATPCARVCAALPTSWTAGMDFSLQVTHTSKCAPWISAASLHRWSPT